MQPLLRPGAVERALLEPGAMEIDVHALHQFYVHGLRERGGRIVTVARVDAAEHRRRHVATVALGDDEWQAPVVANAAGAWADVVAGCSVHVRSACGRCAGRRSWWTPRRTHGRR